MHKILLIDCDTASAKKIASALTKSGFEVIIASFESEWLQIADEVSPDAVVVKESAQLDGSRACQQIRHLFDLPLIFLGNKPEGEVCPSTLENGTDWDYYMRLPVKHEELAVRIKVLLRRYGKARKPAGSEGVMLMEEE